MNQAIQDKNMNINPSGGVYLLITSYLLNITALLSNVSPIFKGIMLLVTALTTLMAFFNQYKTFQKNFRTIWIVVKIEKVFTLLKPKKNRHRGISLTKKKTEQL